MSQAKDRKFDWEMAKGDAITFKANQELNCYEYHEKLEYHQSKQ